MKKGVDKNEMVLAVIVVYNPDMELLHKNICAFVKHVDKVMIWDNTPGGTNRKMFDDYSQYKFIFQGTGKNVGISKALNYALEYEWSSYEKIPKSVFYHVKDRSLHLWWWVRHDCSVRE